MYPEYEPDRPARRPPQRAAGRGAFPSVLLVLLGAALAVTAYWAGRAYFAGKAPPPVDPNAPARVATPAAPLDGEEEEAVAVFEKVKPSVVNVDVVMAQRAGFDDGPAGQAGTGSGFIWDDDGRIVTNYHVVQDVRKFPNLTVRVVLADRTAYDAVVIAGDPTSDLAVLQFAPHNRPPREKIRKIDLGTSHDLRVGQRVYAIGNPLGWSLTLTKGIISALDRSILSPARTVIPGAIQTDAAINPGNSGGPLLDKSGRLIGVNTAIATTGEGGGSIGIGFAIPADRVNEVVTQIVQTGRVLRPDLGITKLYDQRALRQNRFDRGVMIESLVRKGPADAAGLLGVRPAPWSARTRLPGDVILSINGHPTDSHAEYERALARLKPGEQARVRVLRIEWAEDGPRRVPKEVEKDVTLTVGGA